MAVALLLSNRLGFVPAFPNTANAQTMKGREVTGSTWKAGSPLIRSGGYLAVAGDAAVADLVGVACNDATGVAGAECLFWPCENTIFEATLEDQGTVGHALLVTSMYTDYGLYHDTGGIAYVNFNDTSTTCVIIVGVRNDADITNAKVRARVLVRFIQARLAVNT